MAPPPGPWSLKNALSPDAQLEVLRSRRSYGMGLRWQVLLSLALLLVITIALIGFAGVQINQKALERQTVQHTLNQASLYSRALSTILEPKESLSSPTNQKRIQNLSAWSLQHNTIQQVVVRDLDLRVLSAVPGQISESLQPGAEMVSVLGGEEPQWSIQSRRSGTRALFVTAPLRDARDKTVGLVSLRASLEPVDALIDRASSWLLAYILLEGLLQLVVGYLLITRLVVKPLEAIGQATHRVARGDYNNPVRVRATNELGRLAEDFNSMTRQVREEQERVGQKVQELEIANRNLAQAQNTLIRTEKLATVGTLAAGVAHEIGNPLAAVLGYMELLKEDWLDDEERADLLQRAEKELTRVDGIIRELLDYARARKTELTPHDLRPILERSVHLVAALSRCKHVDIQTRVSPDFPLLHIDDGRLQQVLVNLFINAADAMNHEGTIQIRAEKERTRATILITDTGPGIPEDLQPRIFDPFFSTKDPGKGTGLGLAICQSIMHSLHGEISIQKTGPEGTTFLLSLPHPPHTQDAPA